MKKKRFLLIVIIIIALIVLLVPIPRYLNDGGSVEYRALLYKVTDYHKLEPVGSNYIEGIGIEILGIEVFNNAKDQTETVETTIERIKLEEVKFIDVEGTDTSKLVKFNNILYGKSYAVIDYAGNLDKSIGTINFLIDKEYMPEINGETNCEELLNSSVLEANDESMVLNVNNIAVLFNAIKEENIKY